MDFSAVESAINYTFENKELLRRALTLASYDFKRSNETLEFFGDAIIEFIVSEKVFSLDGDEGRLTDLRKNAVSDKSLAEVSKRLGLDKFLIKGEGDNKNKKAVPSVYEAVTAAIYLDGGMSEAKKFVLSTLDFSAKEENYIGILQEWLQSCACPAPEYFIKNVGTAQSPAFEARVSVLGDEFKGEGGSKQQAKQRAAERAVNRLKKDGKI